MTPTAHATVSSAPAANWERTSPDRAASKRNVSLTRASSRRTARSIWNGSDSAISNPIVLWSNCGKSKRPSSGRIVLRPRRRIPALVGGVDVAYPNADEGVAAYALVETATGRLVWSTAVRRRVVFPYVTTYLSFREIPILLDLLDEVRAADRMTEVLLVDGSGILHHRHAGIASHLGVVASIPTIGVTKKLLCGSVDIEGMAPGESRPVVMSGGADISVCRGKPADRHRDSSDGRQSPADLRFTGPSRGCGVLRASRAAIAHRPPPARAALLGRSAGQEERAVGRSTPVSSGDCPNFRVSKNGTVPFAGIALGRCRKTRREVFLLRSNTITATSALRFGSSWTGALASVSSATCWQILKPCWRQNSSKSEMESERT